MSKPKAKSIKANPASSRIQFLHQAAALLAHQHSTTTTTHLPQNKGNNETIQSEASNENLQLLSRRLVSDLRAVSLKAQVRLPSTTKHSVCKNCNTVLIEGSTCTREVENKSKGGKKPWADMVVHKCNTCGVAKRFPLSAARQKRRPHRIVKTKEALETGERNTD